jgi:hypothetical protein
VDSRRAVVADAEMRIGRLGGSFPRHVDVAHSNARTFTIRWRRRSTGGKKQSCSRLTASRQRAKGKATATAKNRSPALQSTSTPSVRFSGGHEIGAEERETESPRSARPALAALRLRLAAARGFEGGAGRAASAGAGFAVIGRRRRGRRALFCGVGLGCGDRPIRPVRSGRPECSSRGRWTRWVAVPAPSRTSGALPVSSLDSSYIIQTCRCFWIAILKI